MRSTAFACALFACAALHTPLAQASTITIGFVGPGVSGNLQLTYGSATDSKYPQAFEVTGITGTFTDTNHGLNLVNVPITQLVSILRAVPEADNHLAPNDFSRFAVATGLSPQNGGFLTYDNLFYPSGSPQTASDFPFFGGVFDIYGLMFRLNNGMVVNFWSNGNFAGNGPGPINYGVAVATADAARDYVEGGVSLIPEPGAMTLVAIGLAGLIARRRRALATTR